MQTLIGEIVPGQGVATRYFDHVMGLIETRSGLAGLHPGTLNLLLPEHFPIWQPDGMISRAEFNMKKQWIKLKRCRLLGIDAVIIRPERHDDPTRTDLYFRLELMAQCHIKSTFGMRDGDHVSVLIP